MVRPEVIRRRLRKLDTFVEYLERAQAYSFDEFRSDIERSRVYEVLQHQLDDIRQLSHVFDRFLD